MSAGQIDAFAALVRSAFPLISCRRIGRGGNYGYDTECGTCPECAWRAAAIEAVPSLGPSPDLDILVLQRRARRNAEMSREPDRSDESRRACQRLARKAAAAARLLYADRYLDGAS